MSDRLRIREGIVNGGQVFWHQGYIKTPMIPNRRLEGCDLEDYAPIIDGMKEMTPAMIGNQPGDVQRCADAMIKVTNSATRNLSMVPLGSDAVATVRKYAELLIDSCNEWEIISSSVDRDGPKQGFYAQTPHYCLLD